MPLTVFAEEWFGNFTFLIPPFAFHFIHSDTIFIILVVRFSFEEISPLHLQCRCSCCSPREGVLETSVAVTYPSTFNIPAEQKQQRVVKLISSWKTTPLFGTLNWMHHHCRYCLQFFTIKNGSKHVHQKCNTLNDWINLGLTPSYPLWVELFPE